MIIPTEPIGSIPRPIPLIKAVADGSIADPNLDPLYEAAVKDTIERFEATGSPVITDGEQRKYQNFWTYSVHGLSNTAPDGFEIHDSSDLRHGPSPRAGHGRWDSRKAAGISVRAICPGRIVAGPR